MPETTTFAFAYHQLLVAIAGAVCLFGTWVGMRQFARARATSGTTRIGWLFMASVGTGAALWAATFLSILALDPTLNSGFAPLATGAVLLVAIVACLIGFEIGSRHFTLAPEAGGLMMGAGILAMHFIAFKGWHVAGHLEWNVPGVVVTILLGLSLSALAVNRANRPVTRWCRHGAAIVLAFMICVMHYALTASTSVTTDPSVVLPADLIPAHVLGLAMVCAVLLVMGSGFSTYVIDLEIRTESADRIHQLSFNDTMTGLPNRIAFNERLAFDAAEAHEKAHKLAAFSIDLDGFKDVNDQFGHGAGDLLLIEVADRMRRILRPGEFLARQSGDEFLGLKMSGNHPQDAQAFAERIAGVFAHPFQVGDQSVTLTASIGFSVFPIDTPERDQVLSNAKLAMHRGKSKQRGLICQYHREMDDTARARRALARDLQRAAARGELELHYQLQTTLADGKICGAEALMRWRHPTRGMISPAEFIPLAEETEAIIAMGEWALRTACHDAAGGKIPGTVAVNLSPVQFGRDDLADTIHAILLETGLSPRRLEVEVTESTIMSDQSRGLHILRKLKAMGVSVSMDDFGTGYSSLATLHLFPFDKIKLDQSFVKRLPDDAAAAAIVRTVLALGDSLGMPVLAEGIETEAQWQFLDRAGCAKGQGYLFARPASLAQLPAAIEATARFVREAPPAATHRATAAA
ncbi:putative bifunctional diguanylate cyclase/phosphodiesterase [Bradyrhizobium roseum]|uniref:putative bifunctional diguanylate cyclase/phosphodiesterase n=1 Tax=Bradyrhizobium roseum TaxID=3056648 RepID=UPI00260AF9B8|nr:EAL domain-containing protein [Bradyrhizobium roseus]WKA26811.1 EAL domain-containing protein [Bradyrhizobium roseus]